MTQVPAKPQRLETDYILKLLKALAKTPTVQPRFTAEGFRLQWEDDGYSYVLNLPQIFPPLAEGQPFIDYVNQLTPLSSSHVILLMRAGSAALGYFEGQSLIAHKVIRKYMVRKKQGKMQISYLGQKGKSRAGSRIRLKESVEFFEEINDKLENWFSEFGSPDRVFFSCPVRLKSPWFGSRIKPPFAKEDSILIPIPLHIHQPTHEELLRVERHLSSGFLYSEIRSSAL